MRAICLLFIFINFIGVAQEKRFDKTLENITYVKYEDSLEVSEDDINIFNFNREVFKPQFFSFIGNHRFRTGRGKLEQDSIYNRICESIIEMSDKTFGKNRWKKPTKYVYNTVLKLRSNYRYYKVFAFRVSLVKLEGSTYYYDKGDVNTELHLIYGSRRLNKQRKKKDSNYEVNYLEQRNIKELLNHILDEFLSRFKKTNFKSRYYTRIGFSIEVDKKTLNKKAIPTAKVVIMIGGKIMSKIRV